MPEMAKSAVVINGLAGRQILIRFTINFGATMLVAVMTEVPRGCIRLVCAIGTCCRPDRLEWQQQYKENQQQAFHRGASLAQAPRKKNHEFVKVFRSLGGAHSTQE